MSEEINNVSVVTTNEESVPVVNIPAKVTSINLLNESELMAAEVMIKKLAQSNRSGIKSIQDGLAMIVWAKELELPFTTIVNHMHMINDKPGFDIHIVRALLLKAACVWEKVKDYQAQYEYTDGINAYNDGLLPSYVTRCNSKEDAEQRAKANPNADSMYAYPVKYYSDFNGNIYKDYQLTSSKFKIITNKQEAIQIAKNGIIGIYRIPAIPIDYVTEYKFTRDIRGKEMTITSSFSMSNAIAAGLVKDGGVYQKYPQIMLATRAFTNGAREIADDILNGITEYTELKGITDKDVTESDIHDLDTI